MNGDPKNSLSFLSSCTRDTRLPSVSRNVLFPVLLLHRFPQSVYLSLRPVGVGPTAGSDGKTREGRRTTGVAGVRRTVTCEGMETGRRDLVSEVTTRVTRTRYPFVPSPLRSTPKGEETVYGREEGSMSRHKGVEILVKNVEFINRWKTREWM